MIIIIVYMIVGFIIKSGGGGVWAIIGINLVYHINTKNDLYIMVL